ncbi:DUF1269 domain-containing protein [Candidatus Dojkabacteria bacterium]|uniref:DUF1269 domain-containing protein n=1 Tax=Candidatus Dojkabacteria bacterium TaxID=2099670 RepID=A0A955RI36_9BACT|nr:DUF1269 domain-containing protein [Candidatus Dojkabacteria bacterium]
MFGPIQFTIISFDSDDVAGELIEQVNAVRTAGVIRLIDFLFVTKSAQGGLMEYQSTDLTPEEREEWGGVVGGLIGLGAGGIEGMAEGYEMGHVMVSQNDFGLLAEDLRVVLQDIPAGSAAMVVLFEHAWALPLKEAIVESGGELVAQGLISPLDLVEVGAELAAAVEAEKEIEAEDRMRESAKKVRSTKSATKTKTAKKTRKTTKK